MDASLLRSAEIMARLSLPPKDIPALSFCATSIEGVQDFLDDLPRTNTPEVLNRLYKAIPEVAGLTLDCETKKALLDLFQPIILEHTDKLTAKLAINEKNARQVSLSLALLKNLALGYKAVAVAATRTAAEKPQQLASTLHAAITVLSKMLTTCWECFFNPPANIWIELHSLYLLAQAHDVESLTPFSSQSEINPALSPRAPYLRILLAGAADPSRFTPQDLKLLLAFLDTNAHLASIVSGDKSGLFTIDPDRDQGAVFTSKIGEPKPHHLRLRTEDLADCLGTNQSGRKLIPLPPRLISQLSRYWSREMVRENEHVDDQGTVTAVFGLTRLHRLMTNTGNIEEYVSKSRFATVKHQRLKTKDAAGELSIPIQMWRDAPEKDKPQQGVWLRKVEINLDEPIDFDNKNQQQKAEPIRDYDATSINLSKKGVCIELSSPPDNLTPGELVGIKRGDSPQWRIGIVRWTRTTPQLTRLAGIELFGKSMTPCAVALDREPRASATFFPGLILHNPDQTRDLLLPSIPFTEDATIMVLTGESTAAARLTQTLESTFHLSIFRLDYY